MTTQPSKNVEAFAESLQWIGQSCIKILYSGKTIYIDPFKIKNADRADLILITHLHFDHFSEEDIKKIATSKTVIFCPAELKEKAAALNVAKVYTVFPNFKAEWEDLIMHCVPAYNILKPEKHPKASGWVGYVLSFGNIKLYHTGDTERIPEMKSIDCDIILLPLGQTYTMNSVDDAVKAVLDTKASVAIPIHFGMYEGTIEDAEKFKKMLEGRVKVIL